MEPTLYKPNGEVIVHSQEIIQERYAWAITLDRRRHAIEVHRPNTAFSTMYDVIACWWYGERRKGFFKRLEKRSPEQAADLAWDYIRYDSSVKKRVKKRIEERIELEKIKESLDET